MSRMGEYALELQEAEDALESHIFNTTQRKTHEDYLDDQSDVWSIDGAIGSSDVITKKVLKPLQLRK